jgi:hypothetical protein
MYTGDQLTVDESSHFGPQAQTIAARAPQQSSNLALFLTVAAATVVLHWVAAGRNGLGFHRDELATLDVLNEETKDHPDIFICRGLKQSWPEFWKSFRYYG